MLRLARPAPDQRLACNDDNPFGYRLIAQRDQCRVRSTGVPRRRPVEPRVPVVLKLAPRKIAPRRAATVPDVGSLLTGPHLLSEDKPPRGYTMWAWTHRAQSLNGTGLLALDRPVPACCAWPQASRRASLLAQQASHAMRSARPSPDATTRTFAPCARLPPRSGAA